MRPFDSSVSVVELSYAGEPEEFPEGPLTLKLALPGEDCKEWQIPVRLAR